MRVEGAGFARAAKVYAPGRPGLEAEIEVYARLGRHPASSACVHAGRGYLVLERLHGVTLYDAVHRGLPIPGRVVRDIDEALAYARSRGLHPHDVHGRNVIDLTAVPATSRGRARRRV